MQKITFALLALLFCLPATALEIGDPAPCLVLDGVDADDKAVTGSICDAVSGAHKYTVLEFMSIHCGFCVKNLPTVGQLIQSIEKHATVRYVMADDDVADVKAFIASHKSHMRAPVAFDVAEDAKKAYGIEMTPSTVIVKRVGNDYEVVFKKSGSLKAPDVAKIQQIVEN